MAYDADRVQQLIDRVRVVPVVVLDSAADALPLADALLSGGLPIAEVTFRTDAAADAIRAMSTRTEMCVGAGTVLTTQQVDRAAEAGAQFVVCPGFSPTVVRHCLDRGIPVFPGVATASEVMQAYEVGLRTVKFFPAETSGGAKAIAALAAPLAMMRFIPTGGVSTGNLADYLAVPAVAAVGGSWMVARALVWGGRFDEITRLAADAVAEAQRLRGNDGDE